MSESDETPANVAPAYFRLEGTGGSYVELQVCPLHPGGVEFLLYDGSTMATVEFEGDEALRVSEALAAAHAKRNG